MVLDGNLRRLEVQAAARHPIFVAKMTFINDSYEVSMHCLWLPPPRLHAS
jgi:hypothetical protein